MGEITLYEKIESLQAAYLEGFEKVKSDSELMANWGRLGISPKHMEMYINTMKVLDQELVNN